jgi:predicted ATP-grasp superfamily ATP-dependent carboligase
VWPIAPEYNGILEGVCEAVVRAGKLLLNSPPLAVRLAASKFTTASTLAEHGLPVVPTYRPESGLPDIKGRWVLKPDDGAGCQGSRIFADRDQLCRQLETMASDRDYVAQPFVQGDPVSMCILARQGEASLLSVNRQRIAVMDSTFVLLGCVVNGLLEGRVRYRDVSSAVTAALPQLWGFAGIDMIAGKHGLQVLEVNPRLTTSYVGLHESLGFNPARLVLEMAGGGQILPDGLMKGKAVDVNLGVAGAA